MKSTLIALFLITSVCSCSTDGARHRAGHFTAAEHELFESVIRDLGSGTTIPRSSSAPAVVADSSTSSANRYTSSAPETVYSDAARPAPAFSGVAVTRPTSQPSGSSYPFATQASTYSVAPTGQFYSRYYDPTYRPPVGDHYVQGYTRSDGTYVQGHYQTNPDNSFWNNYSSSGHVNPYTGRTGYKLPPISSYGGGSTYVHSYTRSNGTYVSPHYRSR